MSKVIETASLVKNNHERVILRKIDSGMVTVEMDIETLESLGLPISYGFDRYRKKSFVAVKNGPVYWEKEGE